MVEPISLAVHWYVQMLFYTLCGSLGHEHGPGSRCGCGEIVKIGLIHMKFWDCPCAIFRAHCVSCTCFIPKSFKFLKGLLHTIITCRGNLEFFNAHFESSSILSKPSVKRFDCKKNYPLPPSRMHQFLEMWILVWFSYKRVYLCKSV